MTTRDDDVLNELHAALDVTPPPGFESRVVRRVRQVAERGESAWIGRAFSAAVALVIVLFLLPARTAPPADRPTATDATSRTASLSVRPSPALESVEPERLTSSRSRGREVVVLRTTRRARSVDAVLLPLDQAHRLRALIDAVAAGQVVVAPPPPVLDAEMPSLPMTPTSPVLIQAMATKPLSEAVSQTEWR